MARKWVSLTCGRCYGYNDRAPRQCTCTRCAVYQANAAANELLRREAAIFFASDAWKEQEKRL